MIYSDRLENPVHPRLMSMLFAIKHLAMSALLPVDLQTLVSGRSSGLFPDQPPAIPTARHLVYFSLPSSSSSSCLNPCTETQCDIVYSTDQVDGSQDHHGDVRSHWPAPCETSDAGRVGIRSFNRDIPRTGTSLTRSTQHMGPPAFSKHSSQVKHHGYRLTRSHQQDHPSNPILECFSCATGLCWRYALTVCGTGPCTSSPLKVDSSARATQNPSATPLTASA